MVRRKRAKRAAAAAAQTKIKHNFVIDLDASNVTAKRRKSTTPRAKPKAAKSAANSQRDQGKSKKVPTSKQETWVQPTHLFPSSLSPLTESSASDSTFSDDERPGSHAEHLRRRALRQVHSNKKMFLSDGTFYRMIDFRFGTPPYSPLKSTKLRFTPEASPSSFRSTRV